MNTRIQRLPEAIVNQIAAGEVVERPASAIKELIENALDAGAQQIDIEITDGGRSLLAVHDDGVGMDAANLALAVERHATSKLPDLNLSNIQNRGFRGEALAAIGAIARVEITSRLRGTNTAHIVIVNGGAVGLVDSAARAPGTSVVVKEIFYATPARLKFLKTMTAEAAAVREVVERQALASPKAGFRLTVDGRMSMHYAAPDLAEENPVQARVSQVMGADFMHNSHEISAQANGVSIRGWISLPTHSRGTSANQYFIVNGRVVKDKLLLGAVRGAYGDLLPSGRHAEVVLWIDVPPADVDVNVHPAKTEVRFRDATAVRNLIVGSLRRTLHGVAGQTTTNLSGDMLTRFQANWLSYGNTVAQTSGLFEDAPAARYEAGTSQFQEQDYYQEKFPLGAARAQVHENYIVAQTANGLVVVDQHAAHERLVYERMKRNLLTGDVPAQQLLIPEIVELRSVAAAALLTAAEPLAKLGLVLENFGL